MIGVGFEPTPPKRSVPETGALNRSAIQSSWTETARRANQAADFASRTALRVLVHVSARIAQLTEYGSKKPRVGGSSSSLSTYFAVFCVFPGLRVAAPAGACAHAPRTTPVA